MGKQSKKIKCWTSNDNISVDNNNRFQLSLTYLTIDNLGFAFDFAATQSAHSLADFCFIQGNNCLKAFATKMYAPFAVKIPIL